MDFTLAEALGGDELAAFLDPACPTKSLPRIERGWRLETHALFPRPSFSYRKKPFAMDFLLADGSLGRGVQGSTVSRLPGGYTVGKQGGGSPWG